MQRRGFGRHATRVLGVEDQVEDHLLDLFAVDDDQRQLRGVLFVEDDLAGPQIGGAPGQRRPDDLVEVLDRPVQRGLARERQ